MLSNYDHTTLDDASLTAPFTAIDQVMLNEPQVTQLTLRDVKDKFYLQLETMPDFFTEWQIADCTLKDYEREVLEQAQSSFLHLNKQPLQGSVIKMVIVSPMLLMTGLYEREINTFTEETVEIAIDASESILHGKVDVMTFNEQLWICVVEAQDSQFGLSIGLPHLLDQMADSEQLKQPLEQPQFGLVTNGIDYMFVKLLKVTGQYGLSRMYSLHNLGNDLFEVVKVLKTISQ